jgi:hypothetical protein
MDVYGDSEGDVIGVGSQLREDLAEAMLEGPAGAATKDPGEWLILPRGDVKQTCRVG